MTYKLKQKLVQTMAVISGDIEILCMPNCICYNEQNIYTGKYNYVTLGFECVLISIDNNGTKEWTSLPKIEFKHLISEKDSVCMMVDKTKFLRNTYSDDYMETFVSVYDIDLNRELWKVRLNFLKAFVSDSLYLSDSFIIQSFHVLSGKKLWHYDLRVYGTYIDWRGDERPHEVKAFLGVWQNELIVAVSNARLLAIDIHTGVLRHEWHKLAGFDSGENEKDLMPPAENFILDAQHNCLMGVFNHYYLEINLLDRSIEVVDLAQEFTRCNLLIFKKPANNPFTDTHLFLVCMKNYPPNYTQWSYDCLVALNRQTHQIDWEYAFEEANLGTNIPQHAGDRLYQLDTGGTLHIFEREEGRNFTPLTSTAPSIPN